MASPARTAPSLPVSGVRVQLREPTGEDELLAVSEGEDAAPAMLALARRLVRDGSGEPLSWPELPAVDLAAAGLLIRGRWLGQHIHTETICPVPGCGEPIDVSFLIPDYLEHHRPRRARGVHRRDDGWLAIAGTEVTFRIPTVEDMVTAARAQGDENWLAARCIRPAGVGTRVMRRVERALAVIAPRLDNHVDGRCPVCGEHVELFFDPLGYVLAELRDASSGLYADVHELAFAYRWSEASILALDRRRRHGYVAMVRGELALA